MAERGGRTQVIAVSLAAIALVTVVIAVIVVATRGDPTGAAGPAMVEHGGPLKHRVAATVVVRLDRDTLESVTDPSGVAGLKVTDAALRSELALGPTDVITAIAGRSVKRQFDAYDALLGASMMNATVLYVDLIRDGKPALLRWELDGDLRTARASSKRPRPGPPSPFPMPLLMPSAPAAPDALIATVKKIDELRYEVPRSTFDAVFVNPMLLAAGARVVPSMKLGQPDGFKIYAVRPSSFYAAIGIHNGDTIRAVNGHPLNDVSQGLDLRDQLKGADSIRIDLDRRGHPEVLEITVTR